MASIVKRGDKYLVRVTRKGQPQANKSFASRRDAEAWAATVEGDIARGVYRRNVGDRITFRELLERYLAEVTPTKRGAVEEAGRIAFMLNGDSTAGPMLGKTVAALSAPDVVKWRDTRGKVVAAATLLREWAILSHCLETARLEWGYADLMNPFKGVRKPAVRNQRNRRIAPDELDAICTASGSDELALIVRLAVETGARRGELLSLTWANVDLKRATAQLLDGETKNGHGRTLPLSPAALGLLRTMPRRLDGRVFSLRPDSVSQAFRRAVARARKDYETQCKASGVVVAPSYLIGCKFHDSRHEACSRLAERGFSTLEIASVSGHRTLQLLSRYVHLSPENLARKLAATA